MENQQTQQKRDVLTKRMKEFLEIFRKNAGRIQASCEKANLNRATYYDWMKKSPKFKVKCEEVIESLKDFVEGKIITHIKSQDNKISADMCKFYAKTKMKGRGYIEKQEIEHSGKIFDVKITEVESASSTSELRDEQETKKGLDSSSG